MKKINLKEKDVLSNGNKLKYLVVLFAVIFVAVLGIVYYKHEYRLVSYKHEFQAVFLSNGQVYFGKIVKENEDVIVLSEVYYLKVNKNLQNDEVTNEEDKLSLVRLGDELHGPDGVMYLVRENVLFTEDLKPDSKVMQAINNYK